MNDPHTLEAWLFEKKPWDEKVAAALTRCGFEQPDHAWRTLTALSQHTHFARWYPLFFSSFLTHLAQSYNPDMALNNFDRLAEKILDKDHLYAQLSNSPFLLQALTVLFSGSQVLTDVLLSNPSYVDWLSDADTLTQPKTRDMLYRDFYVLADSDELTDQTPVLLRKFKKREYIRLGLRDLMGHVDLREHVENLSDLADVCLQVAYEYSIKSLKEKYGTPVYTDPEGREQESEFAILSMGKLGGRELNYSSDIDLIYIYTSSLGETLPDNGQTSLSNHEFHTKLGQKITQTLSEITAEGNVFRVDLDLRPEGRSGELVNSLTSCETYYESWGRTWERQALLKARVSAGSQALGTEFLNMIRPFVIRKSLDFNAIEEVKSLKKKVDLDLKQKNLEKGHIKLGFGGIREVEFIVQSYQLLFGGRDQSLRDPNTLSLIEKLKDRDFMTETESEQLREAYIFLRNLENRVQISFGLQTYHLPKDEKNLAILARKMGYQGKTYPELVERLNKEFERHTQFVGNMYAHLFKEDKDQQAAGDTAQRWVDQRELEGRFSEDTLKAYPFQDPKRAFRFLTLLRDGPELSHASEKSIQIFYAILPHLLDVCRTVPDPDAAVDRLVRFMEASHAREIYLTVLHDNHKFLEILLIVFGTSGVLSALLIQRPNLIDVISNHESLYLYKTPAMMREELKNRMVVIPELSERNICLRKFKQGEELRIGLRFLIHETDVPGTLEDLSHLADIYLQSLYSLAREALESPKAGRLPERFAVIGLGKLGGQEINFGSDLDLIFVYEEAGEGETTPPRAEDPVTPYAAIAQKICQLASQMASVPPPYKIDTDLRPEGSRGALVVSLKGYEDYFNSRGQIWEQQVMTRARFIAGCAEVGEQFIQRAHRFTYRPKLEYGSLIEISRLRDRMEKELAQEYKKGVNVKLGAGGLADIEFSVQVLQLMHGHRNPKLRGGNVFENVRLLSHYGILNHDQAESLSRHYHFLRKVECALRLLSDQYSSYLPRDEAALAVLARLLGYAGDTPAEQAGALMDAYKKVTGEVRQFYRANLDVLLRTSL
ncbi:MAG: bifunctional [glutamate--ammonia ligase]-adenylyl-L-tyrosine phosphorylase/[glutamate--ammonia-ligase] adenylyltransferase [Nitrospinae bacterium]|nr:bifunctional [glutamate--ammonia ligase]-adenylyl-L-tyrosine phosphorylase/[glutamate--ammonia-ligase] adenylyltransferase [Nitrospinota bacterium]